jgi:hypothetical protein
MTDVTSSGTAQNPGYGATVQAPPTALQYTQNLPAVRMAMLQGNTDIANAKSNYATQLGDLATWFGDPTAFGNPLGLGAAAPFKSTPTNFLTDTSSSAQGGPPQNNFASWLQGISPTVAKAALTNTVGPGGAIGNSIVAQLHLAAGENLRQAINSGFGGFQGSGQVGHNANLAQIQNSQNMYNAYRNFIDQVHGLSSGEINSISQAKQNMINAIQSGWQSVINHPNLFPVQSGNIVTPVGGSRGLPSTPMGAGQTPTINMPAPPYRRPKVMGSHGMAP